MVMVVMVVVRGGWQKVDGGWSVEGAGWRMEGAWCCAIFWMEKGLFWELNPGPLAPEARIMPLDQTAMPCYTAVASTDPQPGSKGREIHQNAPASQRRRGRCFAAGSEGRSEDRTCDGADEQKRLPLPGQKCRMK